MCCTNWDASKGKILDRLIFAFEQDVEELKEKALRHAIDTNAFVDLIESQEWASLIHEDELLAQNILSAFENKK